MIHEEADASRHDTRDVPQKPKFRDLARFAAPQALTSLRIIIGVFVIFLPARGETNLAAKLWLFGLATDALDGACARKLGVASDFGELFDYFSDYLYYVVAPAVISYFIMPASTDLPRIFLLSLPCLLGAMRYARKAGLSETEFPGIPASPGLATVVYGLFVIALVFLNRENILHSEALTILLLATTPFLSFLMMVRTRYPKLGVYPWILVPLLAGSIVMPFFQTGILAAAMLGLVAIYVFLGPLLVKQHDDRSADSKGARKP